MKIDRVGWDIGGAHVKAAAVNSAGEIIAAIQRPCPLWKGLDRLRSAVGTILAELKPGAAVHAVTMTGELADVFAGRDDGVQQIIQTMAALLPGREMLIFAGKHGFLKAGQIAASHYQDIASANWLASAELAAQALGSGLFVDIGSTTTDILVFKNSLVCAEGYTDYQRLLSQELVYTGIVRTPVMAVAQTAVDEGRDISLMAEYFATMADVYRITGELNELHDQTDTADGADKTVFASARRLARMVGCDFAEADLPRWRRFADDLKSKQLAKIQQACERRLAVHDLDRSSMLVGAGIGRFLANRLADRLDRPYRDFDSLLPQRSGPNAMTAADCAPAVAVAWLAGGRPANGKPAVA